MWEGAKEGGGVVVLGGAAVSQIGESIKPTSCSSFLNSSIKRAIASSSSAMVRYELAKGERGLVQRVRGKEVRGYEGGRFRG